MSNFILKLFNRNCFLLPLCLAAGFCLGYILRFDNFWDFNNYHYYNAFAFLHNRLNYDIVPGSVNTFFNPLPDLPLYFMVHYLNDYPKIIYGIQGLYFGVCLFFLLKICALMWDNHSLKGISATLLSAVIAVTGYGTWQQIGSSTNEIQIAALFMPAIYLWLKEMFNKGSQTGRGFMLAGLLMGIALGLKPTVITYCLSSGICTIFFCRNLKRPLLYICLFALGGLTGYLISNGWLMWRYWNLYGNPFFPFANAVFKSEYFDDLNFRDTQFLPDAKNYLLYPFIWVFNDKVVYECGMYDLQLTVFYITIWGLFLAGLFSPKLRVLYKQHFKWCVYFVFLSLSFFIWMGIFSILRYALMLEMLSALYICYLTISLTFAILYEVSSGFSWKKTGRNALFCLLIIITGVFLAAPVACDKSDRGTNGRYMEIEELRFPENSVIKMYNFPTALFLARWAENSKIRGLGFMHTIKSAGTGWNFVERGRFRQMRNEILQNYKGPVIILYSYYPPSITRDFPYFAEINRVTSAEIKENNLYCRPLKESFNLNYNICVPQDLKKQILGDD